MSLSIVGSTYREFCDFPGWSELWGSGLRSACLASQLGSETTFHTFVGAGQEMALKARSKSSKVRLGQVTILPENLSFSYVHGFSIPRIRPPQEVYQKWKPEPLEVEAEAVMFFGMLEADAVIRGKRVVYDPQNPHNPRGFALNGSSAGSLAFVCNLSEGRKLTNGRDPEEIAKILAASESADVVIIKSGSRGACVYHEGKSQWIPAYQTKFVWPIGSGDVFAGTFAHFWGDRKVNALEAANLASRQTAEYCETRRLNAIGIDSAETRVVAPAISRKRNVYLAGPFFSMAQIWLIGEARAALYDQGFEVFSPLHDVGRGPAEMIYEKDIDGIKNCDILYAVVDGLDAGTLYEIGYARSLGKPVVAFVQNEKPEDLKMLKGSKCLIEEDFVTSIYKTSWIGD